MLSKSKDLAFIVNGKFWVNNHAHIVKPLVGLNIKFLCFYFNSLTLNEYVSGTAQPKLSQTNLNRIPIPYCCEEEQDLITKQLESQFSNLNYLEKTLTTNIEKLKALQQSILKKAFEGKLVKPSSMDRLVLKEFQSIKEDKRKYFEQQKVQKKDRSKKNKKMDKSLSIEDILNTSSNPILAKEVWENSKYKDDIEAFYAELKKLQGKVKEVEKGILALTNES